MLGRDTVQGEDLQRQRFCGITVQPCSDSAMGWTCSSHSPSLVKSNSPTKPLLEGKEARGRGEGKGKEGKRGKRKGVKERGRRKRREKGKEKRKWDKKGEGGRQEQFHWKGPTSIQPLLRLGALFPTCQGEKNLHISPAWDTPPSHDRILAIGTFAISPVALAQLLWKGKMFHLL